MAQCDCVFIHVCGCLYLIVALRSCGEVWSVAFQLVFADLALAISTFAFPANKAALTKGLGLRG